MNNIETPMGVNVRGYSLRVYFSYQGKRYYETLNLPINPENISYAGNKVAMVRQEIKAGTFNYANHFPHSKHLADNQFSTWIDHYLSEKSLLLSHETYRNYRSKIKNHIRPYFGELHPMQIDYKRLLRWKNQHLHHLSTKSIRDIINILASILTTCIRQGLIHENPAKWLEIGKNNISDPNPFTLQEIEKICTTATHDIAARNLAQFMLWTGPRPSEALGLAWEDVNMKEGYLYIRRALVSGKYKSTKTRRSRRIVELLPQALAALESQKQFTLQKEKQKINVIQIDNRTIRTEMIRSVFCNQSTQKPYPRSDAYIHSFWKTHLKNAEVAYRGINQCRHTFASQMLSIPEVPDAWIVQQLGHSDTTMLYKHYGQLMQSRNRNKIVDIAALHLQQNQ